MILILCYTGVRVSELLDLKKQNVNLDEHYFTITKSKTQSGIRKVPIGTMIYPFFKAWCESSQCDYVFHTPDQNILRIVTITTATGIHLWFDSNMIKHHIVADTHVYLYLQLHRYHKHIKN